MTRAWLLVVCLLSLQITMAAPELERFKPYLMPSDDAEVADVSVVTDMVSSISDFFDGLPVSPVRAGGMLEKARSSLVDGDVDRAVGGCADAVRLAAKELRDAFVDQRDAADARPVPPGAAWVSPELDMIDRLAGNARADSDYGAVLHAYVGGLALLSDLDGYRRARDAFLSALATERDRLARVYPNRYAKLADVEETARAAFGKKQTDKTVAYLVTAERLVRQYAAEARIPPPPEPVAGCPPAIQRKLDEARDAFNDGSTVRGRGLLWEACEIFSADMDGLSADQILACLSEIVGMAGGVDRHMARYLLFAMGRGMEDTGALRTGAGRTTFEAVKRLAVPTGFDVVSTDAPALPLRKGTTGQGVVLDDRFNGNLIGLLPPVIRLGERVTGGAEADRLTFVLVPAGRVFLEDDERVLREIRNPRPFYMSTREVSCGDIRAFSGRAQGRAGGGPSGDAALARVLAGKPDIADALPAPYARLASCRAFAAWIDTGRGGDGEHPAEVLRVPTLQEWQFAACLDILTRAMDASVVPSYTWWKRLRKQRAWDDRTPHVPGGGPAGGWLLRDLFGNMAELVLDGSSDRLLRCGGSFDSAFSAMSSHPFYPKPAEEGREDLGFRLVLTLDTGARRPGETTQ